MGALLGTVNRLLAALPSGSRRFVVAYSLASGVLALLDIAALGLIALVLPGLVGGGEVTLPVFGTLSSAAEVIPVILVVSALFIGKSVAALALSHWGLRRFADHEAAMADRLLRSYLSASWSYRLTKGSSTAIRNMDLGLQASFNGFLMPFASLVAELSTFAAVGVVLLVAQPVTALVAIGYFTLVALLLYRVIARRAARVGAVAATASGTTVRLIQEAFAAIKEITLRDRTDQISEVAYEVRTDAAQARALALFYSMAPRYVLEAALMGGFLAVGGVAYVLDGVAGAASAIALFGIAGFRIVPSLTRGQAVLAAMHAVEPYAKAILDDMVEAEKLGERERERAEVDRARGADLELPNGPVDLELDDVTFTYPGGHRPAVRNVSLTVKAGTRVAVVGASGSGKSTLADIVLGLLTPQGGALSVAGQELGSVLPAWRRRVGYVPQEVALFDASVRQNVALSWRAEDVDDERVLAALADAQLLDVVADLPGGLDSPVGERGLRLSGGQRQRMGIARALYTRPQVLVLDEATSALDTSTEAAVNSTIMALGRDLTVLVIAHRLSTIRDCDAVVFLHDGGVVTVGTFDEVVAAVPDFARQASLAGLSDGTGKPTG